MPSFFLLTVSIFLIKPVSTPFIYIQSCVFSLGLSLPNGFQLDYPRHLLNIKHIRIIIQHNIFSANSQLSPIFDAFLQFTPIAGLTQMPTLSRLVWCAHFCCPATAITPSRTLPRFSIVIQPHVQLTGEEEWLSLFSYQLEICSGFSHDGSTSSRASS